MIAEPSLTKQTRIEEPMSLITDDDSPSDVAIVVMVVAAVITLALLFG